MKDKPQPTPGRERIAAERARAAELGLAIPPGIHDARAELTRTLITPPTAPGPAPRVAPPGVPRRLRLPHRAPGVAALRAAIADHLRHIEAGAREQVPALLDAYGDLAASAASTEPAFAELRGRVLCAAFGADYATRMIGGRAPRAHGSKP
jgi:hypothetical protein